MVLARITTIDVAFVGAIAGAVGASSGLVSGLSVLWSGRAERKHQRDLARRQLLHDEMRSGYADYLERTYRVQEIAIAIQPRPYPALGENPTIQQFRQDRKGSEEWRHSAAVASTICSEGVAAAMDKVIKSWSDVVACIVSLEGTPDQDRSFEALTAAKRAISTEVADLERLMRADVRA